MSQKKVWEGAGSDKKGIIASGNFLIIEKKDQAEDIHWKFRGLRGCQSWHDPISTEDRDLFDDFTKTKEWVHPCVRARVHACVCVSI